MLTTSDFDYDLPEELIAQEPACPRDSCRLLVLNKDTGAVEHRVFSDVLDYIDPGDLLVANETRVMPARLIGRKENTGGLCEMLLLHPQGDGCWECLVKPGKRLKPGARVQFCAGGAQADPGSPVLLTGEVVDFAGQAGERIVRFEASDGDVDGALHACGAVPLPPYITKYAGDAEMYQTVYSTTERSAAAPTAGLHFTPELIDAVKAKGARWETVELQVGLDTFRIVTEEDPTQHVMHTELFTVPQRVIDAIEETHKAGGRVIAVGTTSTRSLESAWDGKAGKLTARENEPTSLFIFPGYTFHAVDALITNFHVPRSTLMMLVSSLAGRDHIMAAYGEAIRNRYRMLSFGDAMLIH